MRLDCKACLSERALLIATGRIGIVTFNTLLLLLSFFTILFMIPKIFNAIDNILELEDISEYMGVILIGYGVAIEERNSFMKIFNLYPKFYTEQQESVDHYCHEYGLCYLLLGLFMEMCVACIKIPNAIINTETHECAVFAVSAIFLTWNSLLMLRHCYFLIRSKRDTIKRDIHS